MHLRSTRSPSARPALARPATLLLTVACIGALSACDASVSASVGDTTPTVAAADLEDQIVGTLKTADGASPDSADCPSDLEGEVGQTLTCTITDVDGTTDVEVEVTSVDGTDVGFDIRPAG